MRPSGLTSTQCIHFWCERRIPDVAMAPILLTWNRCHAQPLTSGPTVTDLTVSMWSCLPPYYGHKPNQGYQHRYLWYSLNMVPSLTNILKPMNPQHPGYNQAGYCHKHNNPDRQAMGQPSLPKVKTCCQICVRILQVLFAITISDYGRSNRQPQPE